MTDVIRIGLISDTHGHLGSDVFSAFEGVDRILNAGDTQRPEILADLEAIAPSTSVWGNVDGPDVRAVTSEEARAEVGGVNVALIHGHQVHPDYEALVRRFPDARVIVHGHTHVPRIRAVGGTLLVNPGAAGKAQKGYPPTVAVLEVRDGAPRAVHLELSPVAD